MASSHQYCAACGAANQPNASFCLACGQSLINTPTPSPTSTAPARTPNGHLVLGHVLKRRYRILDQLGEGGMGSVYKAQDIQLGGRLVAVKEMSQSGLYSQKDIEEATAAFRHEALMLADLRHQSLPRIYDHFGDSGCWYLVMDYIEGETLSERLNKANGGRLPIEDVLAIGTKLCDVLAYLHTHIPPIIFRDMKPDNVMLSPQGHIYLIDFGIARHFKLGKANDTRPFVSSGYAPPEQYQRGQTTQRSDIYSLGATLHELLSGEHPANTPFRFAHLHLGNQSGGTGLERLILQMVEMDANKRPANVVIVKQELHRIADQRSSKQKSVSQPVSALSVSPKSMWKQSASTPLVPLQAIPKQPVPPSTVPIREMQMSHSGLVWSVAWSPDGARLASGSEDKTVQVWDTSTGSGLFTYRGHAYDAVRALAWSPDGKRIASAGWDKTVQIWDAATGKSALTYRGHSNYVRTVVWSPDRKYIASAGKDKTVQVWNAITGSRVYMCAVHTDVVNSVVWSPDGTYLASASHDKTVQIWEATTGKTFFTYGHASNVCGVSWSPDGRYIASCSEDKTAQVWDVASGSQVFTYSGHSSWVYTVTWSPDSKRLASASKDRTVHIWEATTGNTITMYPCQTDQVLALAWAPDGAYIAFSDNKKVQIKLAGESFEQVSFLVGTLATNTSIQSPDGFLTSSSDSMHVDSSNREGIIAPPTKLFTSSQLPENLLEDFFIIYNSANRSWAEWIAWQLEEAGYSAMISVYGFRSDSSFEEEVKKAIAKAKRALVVLSPEYLNTLSVQSKCVDAFKRVVINEQERLLLVCENEQACEREFSELLKSIKYINIDEEDEAIACTRLLGSVQGGDTYRLKARPQYPGKTNRHLINEKPDFPPDIQHHESEPILPLPLVKRIEIFFSYSHKDEALREELDKHLSTLKRQGLITWYDREIGPGKIWRQEIDARLSTASIILLLISPDFIHSEYCYTYEMGRAMKRHNAGEARVIPIILRPTDLEDTPFEELQALPKYAQAVTTWSNRDEAFRDVVRGIRKAFKELTTKTLSL